jgi:hypothetical protein
VFTFLNVKVRHRGSRDRHHDRDGDRFSSPCNPTWIHDKLRTNLSGEAPMRTHALINLFSIPLLSVVSLSAQQGSNSLPPLTERVTVRTVNVDATVVDASGQPVTGLTANDFEVFEDGKPQSITGFYEVQNATVQLARNPERMPVTNSFRRKVVLMVDNNSIQRPPRDAALEFVENFIDEEYDEKAEWAVMAVASGTDTLQPFTATTDRPWSP